MPCTPTYPSPFLFPSLLFFPPFFTSLPRYLSLPLPCASLLPCRSSVPAGPASSCLPPVTPPTLPPFSFIPFFSSPHSLPLSRASSLFLSLAPHSSPENPVSLLLRRPPISRRRPHKQYSRAFSSSSSVAAQKPTPKSTRVYAILCIIYSIFDFFEDGMS
jgi:hypothetical protein